MGKLAWWWIVVTMALGSPLAAWAQCRSDVECKGDRVCDAGQCISPRPERRQAEERYLGSPGLARAAGYTGLVLGMITLGLAAGSIATLDSESDGTMSQILGGSATLVVLLGTPSVALMGSLSRGPEIWGSLGLRIVGWTAYPLTILAAGGALASDAEEATPFIVSAGVLGTISLLAMAIDGFSSASEIEGVQARRGLGLGVMPSMASVRGADGVARMGLGVAGRF